MKKVFGEWCIDINMNNLMLLILEEIVHKPKALTGDELRYIRTYLEMTTTAFALYWTKNKFTTHNSLILNA